MSTQVIKLRIDSTGPLLMHNPASMGNQQGPDGVKTRRIPKPKEEAEQGVYSDNNGDFYLPADAFRISLLSAAKGRRIGKFAAASILAGSVFPVGETCTLWNPKTNKPIKKYDKIYTCRAVVQRQGVLRSRPQIDAWWCELELEIDMDFVPEPEMIVGLYNIAGRIIGVGDFRPEKKGRFGRYRVTLLNGS